jgi:putative Ca2+/H+ antiporter (TMEM165/GDT1 family)
MNALNQDPKSVATINTSKAIATPPSQPKFNDTFWAAFSSTFLTIFLAEMGDKTQLVTLLMSAESQSPIVVLLGAAAALVTTSLLGVLIGYWLARKLSTQTLHLSVALLLMAIAGLLLGDIIS